MNGNRTASSDVFHTGSGAGKTTIWWEWASIGSGKVALCALIHMSETPEAFRERPTRFAVGMLLGDTVGHLS
jgi:hypothetical protein